MRASRVPGGRTVVRCAVALSIVVISMLARPAVSRATPLDPQGDDWEGLSDLVRLARTELDTRRVVVTQRLDLDEVTADDALLLVHPERELDAEELEAFMHAGGRIILMDDYGTGDALLAHFRIRRVPLPTRPAQMLRGNPAFAVAEPVRSHRAVGDATHVVTNHATGMTDTGLAPLLAVRGQAEPDVLFAVAGIVGQGRLLALGDASIAMNAMLRYPGNRDLARALLRYTSGDETPPKGRLFVMANDFEIRGRFGAGAAAGGARRWLRTALAALHAGVSPVAAYLAALVVGLAVVVWASARAGRTHTPSPPRFVRATPIAAQGGVAGHAAALAAPGVPRATVLVELKSAVEEALATSLGLERVTPREDLVAKAESAGLLDGDRAKGLRELLARWGRVEDALAAHGAARAQGGFPRRDRGFDRDGRVSAAELEAAAKAARDVVEAIEKGRHGRV